MKDIKIPMTWEEFELHETPLGWKSEYSNGYAYITPRDHGIMVKITIEKREIESNVEIKLVSETTNEQLSKLFYTSFVNSVEYYCYSKYEVKKASIREIANFFNGERGIPQLDLCKIAFVKNKLVGACLVSKYKFGYKDEILFVHPKFQRQRIGTALVSSVLNDLAKRDEKVFWSEHHICNELSTNWHRKFGFVEEPDIMTIKFRLRYFKDAIWRNEKLGKLEGIEELKTQLTEVERQLEILEEIEKLDPRAAWLNWKFDY